MESVYERESFTVRMKTSRRFNEGDDTTSLDMLPLWEVMRSRPLGGLVDLSGVGFHAGITIMETFDGHAFPVPDDCGRSLERYFVTRSSQRRHIVTLLGFFAYRGISIHNTFGRHRFNVRAEPALLFFYACRTILRSPISNLETALTCPSGLSLRPIVASPMTIDVFVYGARCLASSAHSLLYSVEYHPSHLSGPCVRVIIDKALRSVIYSSKGTHATGRFGAAATDSRPVRFDKSVFYATLPTRSAII
jgi:hypothetical protein